MRTPGPTKAQDIQHWAGNILRVARAKRGLTQRQLAASAGVARSTVGRIESGAVQPTIPTLAKLLAAIDLELRVRIEECDDHDDVLDKTTASLTPAELAARFGKQDAFLAELRLAGRGDR